MLILYARAFLLVLFSSFKSFSLSSFAKYLWLCAASFHERFHHRNWVSHQQTKECNSDFYRVCGEMFIHEHTHTHSLSFFPWLFRRMKQKWNKGGQKDRNELRVKKKKKNEVANKHVVPSVRSVTKIFNVMGNSSFVFPWLSFHCDVHYGLSSFAKSFILTHLDYGYIFTYIQTYIIDTVHWCQYRSSSQIYISVPKDCNQHRNCDEFIIL